VPKPWRLTTRARRRLVDIAIWTHDTFGQAQAEFYEAALVAQCEAIAHGTAHTRPCRSAIDPQLPDDLYLTRAGSHVIVFTERDGQIVITDILHAHQDLARLIADLPEDPSGGN